MVNVPNELPNSNSSNIPVAFQAICLKSPLYGRAKFLFSGTSNEQLTGEGAENLLVGSVCQTDEFIGVNEAYLSFNALHNTIRGNN